MKAPKNIDKYVSADDAARDLETMAANIRANAAYRPFVRWTLGLWFWNERWLDRNYVDPGDVRLTHVSYLSGKNET